VTTDKSREIKCGSGKWDTVWYIMNQGNWYKVTKAVSCFSGFTTFHIWLVAKVKFMIRCLDNNSNRKCALQCSWIAGLIYQLEPQTEKIQMKSN